MSNKIPDPDNIDECLQWVKTNMLACEESSGNPSDQLYNLDAAVFKRLEKWARLGVAIETKVMETREPRHGETLAEMHPAMRDRYKPSCDMGIDNAGSLLDAIFALVI